MRGALKLGEKKSGSEVPKSMNFKGKTLVGEQIANGFNEFFSSVGHEIVMSIPKSSVSAECYLKDSVNKTFKFQELCDESIVYYCLKLKDKTSAGFDGVSAHVIKRMAPVIITPLRHLFNLSLKTGYLPPEFKISKVIPLFKSGKKDDFGNYRPISIIPAFAKLFELVVNDQIRSYFKCFGLFSNAQYGFRKGSNPTLAVAKFIDKNFQKTTGHFVRNIY